MDTEVCLQSSHSDQWLAARLDAIDRLLIGALPRESRIAVVADIESRLRATQSGAVATFDAEPMGDLGSGVTPSDPGSLGGTRSPLVVFQPASPHKTVVKPPRSKAALISGIAGIASCALLFFSPIAYIAIAAVGEMLDETIAIGGLFAYGAAIAFAGGLSLLMGLVGLWRSRKKTGKTGRGWAVAGLCLAPVPFGVTAAVMCLLAFSLFGEFFGSFSSSTSVPVTNAPIPASAPVYLPAGSLPNAYGQPEALAAPSQPGSVQPSTAVAGKAMPATVIPGVLPAGAEVPATLAPLSNNAIPATPPALPMDGAPARPDAPSEPSY